MSGIISSSALCFTDEGLCYSEHGWVAYNVGKEAYMKIYDTSAVVPEGQVSFVSDQHYCVFLYGTIAATVIRFRKYKGKQYADVVFPPSYNGGKNIIKSLQMVTVVPDPKMTETIVNKVTKLGVFVLPDSDSESDSDDE